jgi:hypothetical protein
MYQHIPHPERQTTIGACQGFADIDLPPRLSLFSFDSAGQTITVNLPTTPATVGQLLELAASLQANWEKWDAILAEREAKAKQAAQPISPRLTRGR